MRFEVEALPDELATRGSRFSIRKTYRNLTSNPVHQFSSEVVALEVEATAAAGQLMRVHIEGAGDFEVMVPAGVQVGQTFKFEIEIADASGVEAMPEAVPLGQPVLPQHVPLAD